jgi:signal transduction histidine kinase
LDATLFSFLDCNLSFPRFILFIQLSERKLKHAFSNLVRELIAQIKFHCQINHIEIVDIGVGVPQEQMQGLFDPSFTKKGSRIKAGIGLFTSYGIVKENQGQIKVESELNKGSTCTVIIP